MCSLVVWWSRSVEDGFSANKAAFLYMLCIFSSWHLQLLDGISRFIDFGSSVPVHHAGRTSKIVERCEREKIYFFSLSHLSTYGHCTNNTASNGVSACWEVVDRVHLDQHILLLVGLSLSKELAAVVHLGIKVVVIRAAISAPYHWMRWIPVVPISVLVQAFFSLMVWVASTFRTWVIGQWRFCAVVLSSSVIIRTGGTLKGVREEKIYFLLSHTFQRSSGTNIFFFLTPFNVHAKSMAENIAKLCSGGQACKH